MAIIGPHTKFNSHPINTPARVEKESRDPFIGSEGLILKQHLFGGVIVDVIGGGDYVESEGFKVDSGISFLVYVFKREQIFSIGCPISYDNLRKDIGTDSLIIGRVVKILCNGRTDFDIVNGELSFLPADNGVKYKDEDYASSCMSMSLVSGISAIDSFGRMGAFYKVGSGGYPDE